jgi:hypothetical protein
MAYVSRRYTVGTNYRKLNTISQLQELNEIQIDAADNIQLVGLPRQFCLLTDLWGSRVSASVTRVCFSLTIQNIHHM